MRFLSIATFLILACVVGNVVAEESRSGDAQRTISDSQFDKLDTNDDDELDEAELKVLANAERGALLNHGLPETYPVTRAAFVDSSIAAAKTSDKPAGDSAKTDDGAKSDGKLSETPAGVPTRNSAKKSRYVPELPSEFNARDKNGDGQIALYEWDRKKYSEFVKLDKNGDGFLTPAELLPKEVLRTIYSKATAPARNPGTPGSPPSGAAAGESDAIDNEARKTFADLDQNKDGMLDESDWGKSRRTRQSFESAGITVSLPINVDAFLPLFRRMKQMPTK